MDPSVAPGRQHSAAPTMTPDTFFFFCRSCGGHVKMLSNDGTSQRSTLNVATRGGDTCRCRELRSGMRGHGVMRPEQMTTREHACSGAKQQDWRGGAGIIKAHPR